MLLVIFDKELLHTVWVSVRSADAVDINEKRTVKSVALLETSQPDNRVVTEQADVAPKCTFAVIQDQGFMDFLVKSAFAAHFSPLDSKRSKQSAEVATFLSTVH